MNQIQSYTAGTASLLFVFAPISCACFEQAEGVPPPPGDSAVFRYEDIPPALRQPCTEEAVARLNMLEAGMSMEVARETLRPFSRGGWIKDQSFYLPAWSLSGDPVPIVVADLHFLPKGDFPGGNDAPFEVPSAKPLVLHEVPVEVTVRGIDESKRPIEARLRRR